MNNKGFFAQIAGVAAAFYGWFTLEKVCAIAGVSITIAGYIFSRTMATRKDKREAEEHALKMAILKRQLELEELEELEGEKNGDRE